MKTLFRLILSTAWGYLIWRLTTTPDFSVTNNSILSWLLSNGGHLIFFGIFAILLPFPMLFSLSLTSLYGLTIEFVQLGIHGRSFSLWDWGLDTFGAIAFIFIVEKLQSKT